MPPLRGEEQWAADIIGQALDVTVRQVDDGQRPGMWDLGFCKDKIDHSVEVVAAADPESIEFWNLINGGGRWVEPELAGGWFITALPTARVKRLRSQLPTLLAALEQEGVTALHGTDRPLTDLGIVGLRQGRTSYPGSIYVTVERPLDRVGGRIDPNGATMAKWAGDFLASPDCADVRRKLASSGCSRRHAFVILPGFTKAPFEVVDALWGSVGTPDHPPRLPREVTDFWCVTTWAPGRGLRWSPYEGWWEISNSAGDA